MHVEGKILSLMLTEVQICSSRALLGTFPGAELSFPLQDLWMKAD